MNPFGDVPPSTPVCDKFLQDVEFVLISWFIALRIVKNEAIVVFRGNLTVDVRFTSSVMPDILGGRNKHQNSGQCCDNQNYTASEALNIALMSDDFPTPDCQEESSVNDTDITSTIALTLPTIRIRNL